MNTTRCDLHLHSAASSRNDEWYSRFFDCPESYADPRRQYELCKRRGMSLVTLTDHDTIEGGLELVRHRDFFLSEEVTAVLPENGHVMHVLAWNITPAQHDEIQARRHDIYLLCDFLEHEGIAHGLAHPLLSPSWQLDPDTFEKMLVLFPVMEGINGLIDRRITSDLRLFLERLTPEVIAALARKHGLRARGATPHQKALTAGSDDHVHRRCATVFTEVDGAGLSPADFLARCTSGRARLHGEQAHLDAMVLAVKHTTYHYLKGREADRADFRSPFVDVMDVLAGREPGRSDAANGFLTTLLESAERASLEVGAPLDILRVPDPPSEEDDARVVQAIARLSDTVLARALEALMEGALEFDLYGMFAALRDLAGGLVAAAPVFFAADHFGQQELQARRLRERWTAFPLPPRRERIAVFTDAPAALRIDGHAQADGRDVLVPYCGELPSGALARAQSASFHPLASMTELLLPVGDGTALCVPSLIATLQWVWREDVSRIEVVTPGPMGLVGLVIAKVLRLPVTVRRQLDASSLLAPLGGAIPTAPLERAAKRYVDWFYEQREAA